MKYCVKLKSRNIILAQNLTASAAAEILVEITNWSGWDCFIEPTGGGE